MSYRIETAEVIAFRLKVPRDELLRLAKHERPKLNVEVEEDGELVVSMQEGESYLRFRPIGAEAMLTEVLLAQDNRGSFFHRVLGPMVVRFGGDLHIRLVWSTPERNTHGDYAEVRINRGLTTYPGLSTNVLAAAVAQASSPGSSGSSQPASVDDDEVEEARPLTALERDIQRLLAKARAQWEEYQRLKGKKS